MSGCAGRLTRAPARRGPSDRTFLESVIGIMCCPVAAHVYSCPCKRGDEAYYLAAQIVSVHPRSRAPAWLPSEYMSKTLATRELDKIDRAPRWQPHALSFEVCGVLQLGSSAVMHETSCSARDVVENVRAC